MALQRFRTGRSRRPADEPIRPPARAVDQIDTPPSVCDRYVLALDIASVFQALAKSAQTVRNRLSRNRLRRSVVEEPDHRHCRLLRARRERPRRRRAAEQDDELAPSHVEHGLLPGTRYASLPRLRMPRKRPQVLG